MLYGFGFERVRAGELARPPAPGPLVGARTGWL